MAMKPVIKTTRSAGLGGPMGGVPPKTVAAFVLFSMMGVLWMRVLLHSKTGPAAASAQTAAAQERVLADPKTQATIAPVSLNITSGRQDVIAADFFKTDRWTAFDWNTKQQAGVKSQGDNSLQDQERKKQQTLEALGKRITLEAIIASVHNKAEKACVNGVVVVVGDKLEVRVDDQKYTVFIKTIQSGQVELAWQDCTIVLKMPAVETGM